MKRPRLKAMASITGSLAGSRAVSLPPSGSAESVCRVDVVVITIGCEDVAGLASISAIRRSGRLQATENNRP